MTPIERTIIEKISRLDAESQRRVLAFVESIENPPHKEHYSATELMTLPYEERTRLAIEALKRAADDDVELFDANRNIDFDDE